MSKRPAYPSSYNVGIPLFSVTVKWKNSDKTSTYIVEGNPKTIEPLIKESGAAYTAEKMIYYSNGVYGRSES